MLADPPVRTNMATRPPASAFISKPIWMVNVSGPTSCTVEAIWPAIALMASRTFCSPSTTRFDTSASP